MPKISTKFFFPKVTLTLLIWSWNPLRSQVMVLIPFPRLQHESLHDLRSLAHWKFHFSLIQGFHGLHLAVSEYQEGKVYHQHHLGNTKKTQANLIH